MGSLLTRGTYAGMGTFVIISGTRGLMTTIPRYGEPFLAQIHRIMAKAFNVLREYRFD